MIEQRLGLRSSIARTKGSRCQLAVSRWMTAHLEVIRTFRLVAKLALSGEGKAGGMADNKTKPTKLSVEAFIDALTDPTRRADAKALVRLLQDAAGEEPKMWGPSIIGFGSYHYKYDSGREGDMPLIGFSPRKAATVLYIMAGLRDSEALLEKLGKHTTGKGCLYIKKLADVDQKVLEALVAKSVAAMRARSKA